MNVTMTLEEYYDLRKRSISKEELDKRQKGLTEAAKQFMQSVTNDRYLLDSRRSLNDFSRSVRAVLELPEENL